MMHEPTEKTPAGRRRTVETLVPDHTLLRVIGRGSYGEVWEARNVMGTPRAVKIIRRDDFDSARPFEREFEGIQRYEPVSRTHAGLVPVLHVGRDADGGCFYYVMELADDAADGSGDYVPKTLRGELRRRHALPVEECIEIGISLASALGHLHRAGLVHRDVKPSNIIFAGGMAKLADVGLVAQLSDSRSMVGTEGYFAPEGTGQPRSDVFSLGKVLYECITGQDRLSFPDVPSEWDAGSGARAQFEFMEIVLRAAEPDAGRRYKDTDEMLADLALLKAGKSVRHLRRVETRLKRTLQVLTFSALGIAVAGGAWFYEKSRADRISAAEQKATLAELHARRAETETRTLLRESLVAEARAVRLSGLAGARAKALDAVRRGLAAGAPIVELRTQAASALALLDAGEVTPAESFLDPGRRVSWSPEGEFVVSIDSQTGSLHIIERSSRKEVSSFKVPEGVHDVCVSLRAAHVAVFHHDRRVTLWDTAARRKVWETVPPESSHRPSFSADGKWIVCAEAGGIYARSCERDEVVGIAPGSPDMRALYLAPNGQWLAALMQPKGAPGKKPDRNLGLMIYSGLPGTMPTAEQAAKVKAHELKSDIQLEGVSISGDSRFVAAAVSEDRVRVWEIPSMAQMGWLRGHQRSVRGTAFHPFDSNVLATTAWDTTTRIWDMTTRQQILTIPVGGDDILISPQRGEILVHRLDGDGFESAEFSQRSALRVYNIPPVTPLHLLNHVVWNADGSLLACSGGAGIIVWDAVTGQPFTIHAPKAPGEWRSVFFHPQDGSLYCSGHQGLFRHTITRGPGGAVLPGPKQQFLPDYAGHLCWSGDRLAVSGRYANDRGCVTLLSADASQSSLLASQSTDQVSASPDGRWIAAARHPDGGGTLWDRSVEPPAARDVPMPARSHFHFSVDSKVLIVGMEKEIRFVSAENPDKAIAPPLMRERGQVIPGHVASSAAAGLIAVSTAPTGITLLDGSSFAPILRLDSPLTPFDTSLAFSPDGTKLALAGGTSRLMVWDVAWIRGQLAAMGLGW